MLLLMCYNNIIFGSIYPLAKSTIIIIGLVVLTLQCGLSEGFVSSSSSITTTITNAGRCSPNTFYEISRSFGFKNTICYVSPERYSRRFINSSCVRSNSVSPSISTSTNSMRRERKKYPLFMVTIDNTNDEDLVFGNDNDGDNNDTGVQYNNKNVKKNNNNNNNNNSDKAVVADNFVDNDDRIRDPKFLERNKRWIVVVDDEEAIRLAVGDFLYDQGYQVTACADADSMLKVCSEPRSAGELPVAPDAIVSDVRMPGKDGIELLGLIRADERLARVPVILLTAKAMTQDRVEGYRAGADVYLPKPFDPNELLSILDNVIQRRRQMGGKSGNLLELKEDIENIKQLMRKNSASVVKKTDVFLTDSERDILELICKGYTNAEIAAERNVNVISINRYIQKLYLDTGTQTRTELVRWAISTGYVSARGI